MISVGIHLSTSPVMVGAAASPPFASSAAGPNSTEPGGGQLGPNGEPVPRVVHQGWLKKRGKIIDAPGKSKLKSRQSVPFQTGFNACIQLMLF